MFPNHPNSSWEKLHGTAGSGTRAGSRGLSGTDLDVEYVERRTAAWVDFRGVPVSNLAKNLRQPPVIQTQGASKVGYNLPWK